MGNGGGLGGFMTDIMGGGNDYYQATPEVNARDFAYGGRAASSFEDDASQAQGRMGPQIDYTNANQSRGFNLASRDQSTQALDMMRQAAMGQGPSVAQQQLMAGRDAALQNSMAMANSARGGGANLAAAQMAAQRQQGEMMGQANQQAATLRANEMMQARQQYGQMAAQQRAQDLQAQGLDAGQAQAQAQLEMQQRGLNDQYSMGMYGLGQRSAEDVQGGGEAMTRDRMGAELGAGQINESVAAGNAGQNAAGGNSALGTMAGIAGAAMLMSDARLKRGIRPIGSNDSDAYAEQQQRISHVMGGGGNDAYSRGVAMGARLGGAFARGAGGDTMGGGADVSEGTKSSSFFSDERLKQQTVGSGNAVDHFMGSLHPVAYHYKPGVPGEDPSAQRYGILAQDVARSPMGRSLVEHTQMGMGINVPHATGALMAGEGELYARQKRLEAQMQSLRGHR